METFSPELRWLLVLLRSALGRAPANIAGPASLDWPAFIATVQRHRVGALLSHRAAGPLAAHCPPDVVRQLKAIAAANQLRALTQAAEQIRLVRTLTAAGIATLPVKGLVLAQQLYGAVGLRHVGDIDLLIRPADAERADAALRGTGLRRTRPDFPLTPRQTAEFLRVKPEFEYVRTAPPQRVELLWRLESLPDTNAVWSGAVSCALGGQPMRTLAPDLNASYLFQHGARHGWFRLFWLVDLALLLDREDLDWTVVVGRARSLGLERPLLQGAALAHELFGTKLPPAFQPTSREQPHITALVAEARRQIAREPAPDEPLGEWLRQTRYRVSLHRGSRAKLAVMRPHLFSPKNWQTLPLPDRWFFLYPPLSPILWLARRFRRGFAPP